MHCDFIAHDCVGVLVRADLKGCGLGWILTFHDVVAVGDKAERDCRRKDGKLPDGNRSFRFSCVAGVPRGVYDSPGADGVADAALRSVSVDLIEWVNLFIGSMCERRRASSEDLNERICVLHFVGVLLRSSIDALHPLAIRSASNTHLGGMDIVVKAVQKPNGDHGRDSLAQNLDIVLLVDLAGAHGVLVQSAHCPSDGTAFLAELSVQTLLAL